MSQNKDLAIRLIEQVWNDGNLSLAPEFFAGPMLEEALGLHEILTTAFPDLRIDVEDLIADGKITESWANQDALGLLQQIR